MPVILDPELGTLMAQAESGAVLWQDAEEDLTALLVKAADEDVASFRGPTLIQTHWDLWRFPCASVLRLQLIIFDRPNDPYRIETFINVAAPEQLTCLLGLLTQETVWLHFFDSRTEHVLTKEIGNPHRQRSELRELVTRAAQDREALGFAWDFDRAKAAFQVCRPL